MQISFKEKKPTLYIVSTPIGNLDDITYRAVDILKTVNACFAEDTRVTSVLFNRYNITTKLISYHEHQKYEKMALVIDHLQEGSDVALVSDAGTPGISDPGVELIDAVIKAGHHVVSIPGVSAGLTALTASGLLMQPHLFVGFLPRKKSEIDLVISKYKALDCTLIFYESPFRVKKTIESLFKALGNRKVVVARELTKVYETYIRTTLELAKDIEYIQKGEYVILVEGNYVVEEITESIEELYKRLQAEISDEKQILKMIATKLNISKKDVYKKIKINNENN